MMSSSVHFGPRRRSLSVRAGLLVFALFALILAPAAAQTPPPDATPPPAPAIPAETELNLINLPTTLSLRSHRSYFRLTHRYARDITRGDFSDLAAELFGLDDGAVIGLEYRYSVTSNLQAGIHRNLLSKTIQFLGKWDPVRQGERIPIALSVSASVEGLNNFREKRQPAIGITLSRTAGDRLAVYATPLFVWNSKSVDIIEGHDHSLEPIGLEHGHHSDTLFLGLGTRLRFSPTGYFVAEFSPRLSGYDPNANAWGIAIEKWTRGHTLQLNFGNFFGSTPGQLARGGNEGQVFMGFNITRKF